MVDDIFAAACLTVSVESGDEDVLRQFCAAAEHRLRSLLKKDVTPEEIYESFVCAAGLLAAADFTACKVGSEVKHFSAGPVSVTQADGERALRLREQAALILGPWCQDAFCFLGVRG